MQTILVAEENGIIRFAFTEAFAAHGYCVLQAYDKAEAVRVASAYQGSIDVLVTDVHLPQLDGHALGRELKVTRPCMQTLIVSTYSADEFPPEFRHVALLGKPVNPYVVVSAVKELLSAHKALMAFCPELSQQ